jgi:hypothetical protein
VTPAYREALSRLQALASDHPEGVPLRITSPAPCLIRLERGHEARAFADASRAFFQQVTWVDLSRVATQTAEAFGREAGAGPAVAATCAWMTGLPGMAVSSDVVALKESLAPVRRSELSPEEQPRLCLSNDLAAETLAEPIRQLVSICAARDPAETTK